MADTTPRRLFVLRHAKAGSSPGADHDRPLAPGADAILRATGREIARLAPGGIDLALGSTATRVRATVAMALAEAPARHSRWLRQLYLADVDRLLAELRLVPDNVPGLEPGNVPGLAPVLARDSVASVLLCGHNPGLHQLVATLLPDGDLPGPLAASFPPAALAVMDIGCPWEEIGSAAGRLVWFSAPPPD